MISNSTPLILLARINHLNLLKKTFEKIIIPQAVKEEILVEEKPGYSSIDNAIKEGWIHVTNPKKELEIDLGKGENSAISLAKERNEKIIIDDAHAIMAVKALDIGFFRTTTVVFIALNKGIINKKEAISVVSNLIKEGYYISPKYYTDMSKITLHRRMTCVY